MLGRLFEDMKTWSNGKLALVMGVTFVVLSGTLIGGIVGSRPEQVRAAGEIKNRWAGVLTVFTCVGPACILTLGLC